MDLELRTHYWDDCEAREAFKEFILGIHGLDFTRWESAGYWDDAYTPFSFFGGGEVIASVCIYLLDAVIHGESTKLAQISAVGTLPAWRRKGLNRELTEIGLDWARDRQSGIFLFADDDAVPFYMRCGFAPIEEFTEMMAAPPVKRRDGVRKLDPDSESDRALIFEHARRRAPVSHQFSVGNARLLMFHALYTLGDYLYEIPELKCLVFFGRKNGRLKIFDIVGERVPRFDEIHPYISDEGDREIEFHFHTDRLGLEGTDARPLVGNHPFKGGAFPFDEAVFPFTCRA